MRKIFFIVICLSYISCGAVDFSPSDSIKVNPSRYNQIVKGDEDIYVKFGFAPDHISAQSAFELQNINGRVEGSFNWKDNTMIFTPQEPLESAQRYFLKYSGEVSDTSGRVYEYNVYTPFFYKMKHIAKPFVSKIEPDNGSTIQAGEKIVFSFSAPMLTASFLDGFSINPDIDCTEEWNEEHTRFILTPKKRWEEHQIYRFSFSETISSARGVPLSNPQTFCLYSSSGAVMPTVSSVDIALNDGISYPVLLSGLEGIKSTDAIRIRFSEQMDVSTTEDAFSITPDIAGHTCWIDETVLIFIPDEEWQADVLYFVTVDASAESKKGLNMPDHFETSFIPDISPLKLLSIEGKETDGFPLAVFNPSQEVDIDVGDSLLPENTYTFSFVFNHAFTEEDEKERLFSGIRFKGIFPPTLTSPKVMSVFWSGDSKLQVSYTGFEPKGRIYSLDVNGLEKMTVRTR